MKNFIAGIIAFAISSVSFAAPKLVLTERNTVVFRDYVSSESIAKLTTKIKGMDDRLPKGEAIYVVLDSGGGEITSGLEFIDNMRGFDRPVHTITQFAASMAFQIVEGLGKRYITREGTLMSHKARGGFFGEFPSGNLDARLAVWKRKIDRLDQQVVDRTGGKHTLESYQKLYDNEYWCDGQDCVDAGFADEMVDVECADDLSGTTEVAEKSIFFGQEGLVPVEFISIRSKCPTVAGDLDWNVKIGGEPVFFDAKKDRMYDRSGNAFQVSVEIRDAIMSRIAKKDKFDRVYQPVNKQTKQPTDPDVEIMRVLKDAQNK